MDIDWLTVAKELRTSADRLTGENKIMAMSLANALLAGIRASLEQQLASAQKEAEAVG